MAIFDPPPPSHLADPRPLECDVFYGWPLTSRFRFKVENWRGLSGAYCSANKVSVQIPVLAVNRNGTGQRGEKGNSVTSEMQQTTVTQSTYRAGSLQIIIKGVSIDPTATHLRCNRLGSVRSSLPIFNACRVNSKTLMFDVKSTLQPRNSLNFHQNTFDRVAPNAAYFRSTLCFDADVSFISESDRYHLSAELSRRTQDPSSGVT